ncbi:hypothetical protein QQS21_011532 [Conoideocrella luteorostrata]|uniref:Zn(2)-C6 fungal-type domain-containing protein n=1 Tax=Conoideocrella luteorostrata TaxID=1105319 RepID=A0AAJ0CF92_9HYPO|nr:hypothetical protein QQS21_011532 [Conoideocrella luteorostrata]
MPKYVPILPHINDAEPNSTETLGLKRRRVGVAIACNACRRRKIRVCHGKIRWFNAKLIDLQCDGQRPTCTACEGKTDECSYRDESEMSQESQSLVLEVIRVLNTVPAEEIIQKLQALKREIDASTILSILRDQDILNLDADYSNTIATMNDELQSLELGPQNPNAYPTVPTLTSDTLRGDVYQQLIQPTAQTSSVDNSADTTQNKTGHTTLPLCDSRLAKLEINHWTNVPITNEEAARAISFYLETDHPLLGFFDPTLFISDLVMIKTDYCSKLLINALLYWACQLNSARSLDCATLTLRFCAEAESLWEHERHIDCILNLVAVQFLSIGYLGQGRGHIVLSYLNEASSMALRMDLFGTIEKNAADRIGRMSVEAKMAHSYAAWGTFNWITHMSLFYRQPGLRCLKEPPQIPIPGRIKFETGQSDLPLGPKTEYMGGAFDELCQFWSILHELATLYKQKRSLAYDQRALCFAEYKFRELLAWSNRLPSRLSRNDQSPHYVQILHVWFHAAILDLFRFSMAGPMRNYHLRTFTQPEISPESVCIASARQLKHLIMNYRLHFPSSSCTILWHSALTYLANTILHYPKDDTWFYYFLLCIYGYERLRPCWRVSQAISTALLSMALSQGDISSSMARHVLSDVDSNKRVDNVPGNIDAPFMIDLDLAITDPDSASGDRVADDFDQNAMLQEYTNVFDSQLDN